MPWFFLGLIGFRFPIHERATYSLRRTEQVYMNYPESVFLEVQTTPEVCGA